LKTESSWGRLTATRYGEKMSQASRERIAATLAAVEAARKTEGLSRHQLADRLGIPFETFRRWFHATSPKVP
jgi:DNA-binding transcriptional regulator YiaG